MYMLAVVNSGSSVRILYPRESYDSWVDPEGSGKDGLSEYHVVAQLGFYILGNLMIPRQIMKVQ
jgi:hypothetical protein